MKKKCLALFLALCLGCALLPAPAFAVSLSSGERKELVQFLDNLVLWDFSSTYYDSQNPFEVKQNRYAPDYWGENIFKSLLSPVSCYLYVDSMCPGEYIAKDPLGKWSQSKRVNAQHIDWILENVFNCSKSAISELKASVLSDRGNSPYYRDGYYYHEDGDFGGIFLGASIVQIEPFGDKYGVRYNLVDTYDGSEPDIPYYALVARKNGFWSLYYLSFLEGNQDPIENGGFIDVTSDDYYHYPVLWAVDQGITYGTGWASFSPDATCTKGQILTFLWRAQGQPKPSGANPFQDVSSGDYFYQAALWAAEKGLVSGPSFQGGAPCTRAMTVSYLWKLAGSPAASGASFGDVPAGTDTAQAVAWAVDEGIAYGTGNGKFSPNATCTRGQIVTFLYRAG